MGLVGPVVVNCKVFVQRLWAASVEWDAPLSEDDRSWWNEFRDGIQDLQRLSISRRVLANVNNEYTLHCFCDASERAYGCCVYVVSKRSDDRTHSQLLIAQSRVAPLRNLTIPRLELCAAVLASQMMEKLRTTTEFDGPTVFWSDSTVVLHWIRSPPPDWKPFVSNRIAEIQRSTKNSHWRHIRTDVNPADILSRGAWPSQILDNDLWWHGPDFLVAAPEFWPPVLPTSNLQSVDRDEMNIEKRQRYTVAMLATAIDDSLLSRFAELSRLLKVVAWCLRFYHNFRLPVGFRRVGVLTPSEIEDALKALIRIEQASGFQAELHQVQRRIFTFGWSIAQFEQIVRFQTPIHSPSQRETKFAAGTIIASANCSLRTISPTRNDEAALLALARPNPSPQDSQKLRDLLSLSTNTSTPANGSSTSSATYSSSSIFQMWSGLLRAI
ncbi:uncharacterized protein LOC129742420 [Uranotaenia lowii]|uniref:uncharacterized protein LOC129742420 n=1 Tax=Uranotaenia lowii TaxID=190385 RepID=UPI002479818E|nr:uncharacterized protein LOC129742420 [Uranotaenia lowii]